MADLRIPLRYAATGTPIRSGDVVAVTINGRTMKGVVKCSSRWTRYVEVWLPATPLARHRMTAFAFRPADLSPLPWMARRFKPLLIVEKAA